MQANRSALGGLLVLDLSRLLPGPYGTMILADHGARVITVEDRRRREDEIFFGDDQPQQGAHDAQPEDR